LAKFKSFPKIATVPPAHSRLLSADSRKGIFLNRICFEKCFDIEKFLAAQHPADHAASCAASYVASCAAGREASEAALLLANRSI
jgi:hypothetical protein